jgi:hypothetical protein
MGVKRPREVGEPLEAEQKGDALDACALPEQTGGEVQPQSIQEVLRAASKKRLRVAPQLAGGYASFRHSTLAE